MSAFFEEWKARQAVRIAERQVLIEQARRAWVGRRAWYATTLASLPVGPVYGEVERIDDEGQAWVVYAYDRQDQPLYLTIDLAMLGTTLTLAPPEPSEQP